MTKNKHGQKHTMNLQMIEEKGFWIKCLYSCEQNEYEAQKLYVETRVEELLSIVENQRISVAKKAKAIRQRQLREQEREVRRGNWKAFIITVVIFVLVFVLLAAINKWVGQSQPKLLLILFQRNKI